MTIKPTYEELEQRVKELEQAESGRKWAEKTLRKSEEKYRAYIEHANDGISVVHKGKLTFVNSRLAEILGYKVDELVGKDFLQFIPNGKLYQITDNLQRRLAGEEVPQVYESRILHKDSSEIDVEFNVTTIKSNDKSNDEPATLTIIRDITERKQAEKTLRESEEKYRSMMEAMKDPAYICSPDFRVEYMNPAMVKRTGRDAIGEPCYKVINELDEKCPWCVHNKVQQGESLKTEIASPKDSRSYSIPIHQYFTKMVPFPR